MFLRTLIISGIAAISVATASYAAPITFATADLVAGTENSDFTALTNSSGGLELTTKAEDGGAVRVYNAGAGAGIYIGAITSGPFNTTGNESAPESGRYSLNFDQKITSLSFDIDYLTSGKAGEEVLSKFFTEHGDLTLVADNYLSKSGTELDVTDQEIRPSRAIGRGKGTLTYTGEAFSTFGFRHDQTPSLIGFTITSVTAELAPVPLPAGFPLLAAGLGIFGFMRRRQRAA